MRKEIWRILKDLEKDKITTNEAYNSLCVLFGVIKNEVAVCPKCKSENMSDATGNIGTCFDCHHIWKTVL